MSLTERIKQRGYELGFELVGVTSAGPMTHGDAYLEWLKKGRHGKMEYLARKPERRIDPRNVARDARSIIVVGMNYFTSELPDEIKNDPSRGIISNYAWADNYHDVLEPRLQQLLHFVRDEIGRDIRGWVYVDHGPVMERDAAVQAGLGWFGRNTMLIHPQWGSWLFLGEILVDVELEYDRAGSKGTCGQCTRCLEACPTDAFEGPYVLDSRRCISYLTIELKESIPKELRSQMGNRIFGCDICQEVCPWNKKFSRPTDEKAYQPDFDRVAPKLLSLINMDQKQFRERFAHTPVKRTKRRGLLRNVAVAIGNWGDPIAIPHLEEAIRDHEPLIRGHAAWALGQIGGREAKRMLEKARGKEEDGPVLAEINGALRVVRDTYAPAGPQIRRVGGQQDQSKEEAAT